jgi:hypothetical protein
MILSSCRGVYLVGTDVEHPALRKIDFQSRGFGLHESIIRVTANW